VVSERICVWCRNPSGRRIQACVECAEKNGYRPIADSADDEICACGHPRRNHDCWYPESGVCGVEDCDCAIPGLPAPMQIE
jgi:hypothetical protein